MARSLALALLFGLAMTASFAVPWLQIGRPASERFALACTFLLVGATLAGLLTGAVLGLLRRRAASAQLAAALLGLFGGTSSLTCFLLFLEDIGWGDIPWSLEPGHLAFWTLIQAASAIYAYLTVMGWLLLPAGVPLTFLFAYLLMRSAR